MEYIITDDISGQVLSTSIKSESLQSDLLKCTVLYERYFCSIENVYRKQGVLKVKTNKSPRTPNESYKKTRKY